MRHHGIVSTLLPAALFVSGSAEAFEFETHRVQGLVNFDLSYGMTYRLDDADESEIAFANGGTGPDVNSDDGELNYNAGLVSNMVRGTAELIVAFENVGLYVRGAAFEDWVQDERLDRTELTSDGQRLLGSDATLLDRYVTATVDVAGTPVHLRLVIKLSTGAQRRFCAMVWISSVRSILRPDSNRRAKQSTGASRKGCCGQPRVCRRSSRSKVVTNTNGSRWRCRRSVRISARSICSAATD